MEFPVTVNGKTMVFDSELNGVMISGKEFVSTKDLPLVYEQVKDKRDEHVRLQMSSNTSTLIPALRVLGIPYSSYFDQEDVVNSQNDITFYWKPSKLAAYYNRFSTDLLEYETRKQTIKDAVQFITTNVENLDLKDEYIEQLLMPCRLLGFYGGFPIYDSKTGMAKLVSRVGIHIDPESIMISTPLDEHSRVVYDIATEIGSKLGIQGVYKKNRVTFSEKELVYKFLVENAVSKSPDFI